MYLCLCVRVRVSVCVCVFYKAGAIVFVFDVTWFSVDLTYCCSRALYDFSMILIDWLIDCCYCSHCWLLFLLLWQFVNFKWFPLSRQLSLNSFSNAFLFLFLWLLLAPTVVARSCYLSTRTKSTIHLKKIRYKYNSPKKKTNNSENCLLSAVQRSAAQFVYVYATLELQADYCSILSRARE